ncbi:MAG: hypothetical protein QOE25_486 [Actinomycetota bacterium]|nr:hypothetical protein [Actinomycetota bacterium]
MGSFTSPGPSALFSIDAEEEDDVILTGDMWVRKLIEAERARRAEQTRKVRAAGLARPGRAVRRTLTRPRNRGV